MSFIAGSLSYVAYLYQYNYIYTMIGVMLIQFVIGYIVNTATQTYLAIRNKSLENERLKEFSKQSTELKCAFCGKTSIVPIRLDGDNEYICPHCDKKNSIYLNITVARSTTPMNVSPLSKSMVEDDKQSVIEEIQGQ